MGLIIEKVKQGAYVLLMAGAAFLDWLLGPPCGRCGARVQPAARVAHEHTDHAGDDLT